MSSGLDARQRAIRFGVATSVTFGSVGWIIGATIPGPVQGTSTVACVAWSLVLGALGYVPGHIAGATASELYGRQR